MLKKGLLPARLLSFVIAATLFAACSGANNGALPQASTPDAAGGRKGPPSTTTMSASPSFSVVQTTHAGGSYNSTVTVTLPKAPTAGHVLVLFFEQNVGTRSFPYSGQVTWPTLATGSQWSYDGSTRYTAIFHHVVQAGESGKYTLNVGGYGVGHEDYMVAEIAGANGANPVNARLAHTDAAGTTSFTFGSGVTPTAAGTFPVAFFSAHSSDNGLSWKGISSGWTVRNTNGEYTEELATGPVQTGTATVNATAYLSGPDYNYPGASDIVLLNSATATTTTSATPAPSSAPTATPAPSTSSTATPAPTPTPSLASNSPYTFDGHPIWTANDWFTTNLTTGGSSYASNTVDPNSAHITSSFYANNGDAKFNINGTTTSVSLLWPVNVASSSTPRVGVTSTSCHFGCLNDSPYDDEGTSIPSSCTSYCAWSMPWQSTFKPQGTCNGSYGGDCHLEVFDPSTGAIYETYKSCGTGSGNCSYTGSQLLIGAGESHNVYHSWNSQMNGGSNNAGIPWMGTALWGQDEALPSINHIIEVAIPGADGSPNNSGGWVAPATYGSPCASNCTYKLPMGARLRLNPSRYTCPSSTTNPQAHKVCVAMETYGIIVVDHNGSSSSFGPSVMPNSDGTNPWNANDLAALNGIPITDFDVMTLGTIH